MLGGYTGKFIRVDLDNRRMTLQEINPEILRKYIGGSGLGARLLYDETTSDTNALSPENVLLFLTGPLTGSMAPTSGRHNVVAKSPLTQAWGESEVGGSWGAKLKQAGYDGVVFLGRSEKPVVLVIQDEGIAFREGSDLWGKDTFETDKILKGEYGDRAGVACIGPAGEKLVKFAAIMTDGEHGRAAGRGGLGAVMGSKNLKAVVTVGSKGTPMIHRDKLRDSIKRMIPIIKEKTKALQDYGTAGGILFAEEIGDLPVKNWCLGEWKEGARKISGQAISASILTGRYFCRACPIGCGRIVEYPTQKGTFKGGGPELETLAALGSLCLIDDLKAISYGNELCNRLGLDTISTGSVIAFAMEAHEKGFIPKDLYEGIDLAWGNPLGMIEMVKRIGGREGLGGLLSEGFELLLKSWGLSLKSLLWKSKD